MATREEPSDERRDCVDDPSILWIDSPRTSRIVLAAAVALLGLWMLWDFLPALAWAAVLAIATWPLYEAVVRRGLGRASTAGLFVVLITLVLVIPVVFVGFGAGGELVGAVERVKEIRQTGLPAPDSLAQVPLLGAYLASWWRSHLGDPQALADFFGQFDPAVALGWSRTLGRQLASRLTILVFALLTLFFLYKDGEVLIGQSAAVINHFFGAAGTRLGLHIITAVRATVNGLVLVGLGEGVLIGIAYYAVGLRHPVLLGTMTGILATVPFGAPLVFGLASLVLVSYGEGVAAIALFAFGLLVIFVADHFVRPVLIGTAIRLPFIWVLLGIFGGLESFGFIGLFLGPAVMAAGITLWREAAIPAVTAQR